MKIKETILYGLFTVNQFCFKFPFKYFNLIFYIIIKGILNMRKDFCQIFELNYLYNFMILHGSTVIYSFSFFFFFKYLDCFRINFLIMRLLIFFSSNWVINWTYTLNFFFFTSWSPLLTHGHYPNKAIKFRWNVGIKTFIKSFVSSNYLCLICNPEDLS